jgi:hypothetical protein
MTSRDRISFAFWFLTAFVVVAIAIFALAVH